MLRVSLQCCQRLLVLLACRFQTGDAGQVGTEVVPTACRCAMEAAVSDDWGCASAPAPIGQLLDDYCFTGRLLFHFCPAGAPRARRWARFVRRMRAKSLSLLSPARTSPAPRTAGISDVICDFCGSNESLRAALLLRSSCNDFDKKMLASIAVNSLDDYSKPQWRLLDSLPQRQWPGV